MKTFKLNNLLFAILCSLLLYVPATSCSKNVAKPNTDNGGNTGTHIVDSKLVGKWMWTKGSDGAYYDNNGVYNGSAYGFAIEYTIGADGNGTCFNHVFSTIGAGTDLEVNISYKGFFESNDQGRFGFFPTSGTYKSSSGENRALRTDELWNTQTGTGRNFVHQYVITTQGERECIQVTASNGVVDTFFKIP